MKSLMIAVAMTFAVIHNMNAFEASYKHYPEQPPVTCSHAACGER